MAQELSEKILHCVAERTSVDTLELSKILQLDHQKVVGALKSIQATGDLLNVEQKNDKTLELTEEGALVMKNGTCYKIFLYFSVLLLGDQNVVISVRTTVSKE